MSDQVTIKYPSEFVRLTNQIFSDDYSKLEEILEAIKAKDDVKVRILIEDKMDSYEISPTGKITSEGANNIIKNLIKANTVNQLYSQYMQLYEELVDNEEPKV